MQRFVLMSSRVAARQLRRLLGAQGCVGIQTGTATGLAGVLEELLLCDPTAADWRQRLEDAAFSLPQAFWYESLLVDQAVVLQRLDAGLRWLLDALPLGQQLPDLAEAAASPMDTAAAMDAEAMGAAAAETGNTHNGVRWQRYYRDLQQLHAAMGHLRPQVQQALAGVLQELSDGIMPIDELEILLGCPGKELPVWLQDALQRLHGFPGVWDSDDCTAGNTRVGGGAGDPGAGAGDERATLRCFRCRDRLHEAQTAAGLVQQAIDEGTDSRDLAVLLPDRGRTAQLLIDALHSAGIPVRGINPVQRIYDWQTALIELLLDASAETMRYCSLLTNPLMPWSPRRGQNLAERFADQLAFGGQQLSEFLQKEPEDDDQARTIAVLQVIRQLAEDLPMPTWLEQLGELGSLLRMRPQQGFTAARYQELCRELERMFALHNDLSPAGQRQAALRQWSAGELVHSREEADHARGVLLLDSGEQLLQPVGHLLVLGMNQGSWEAALPDTGVFDIRDSQALAAATGLALIQPAQQQRQWRQQIRTLPGYARESLTVLLSRLDDAGQALQPADALEELGDLAVQDLAIALDSGEKSDGDVKPGTALQPDSQLELGIDLLAAVDARRTHGLHVSASSLNTLMVSPLAWLLKKIGVTSRRWGVCGLDQMVSGTIVHSLLENYAHHCMQPGIVITNKGIDALLERETGGWLTSALQSNAPYLLLPQWRLERAQLEQDCSRAVAAFHRWRTDAGWRLSRTEQKLQGEMWNLETIGYADCVLQQDDAILILDYKHSKSESRLLAMNSGWDLQTMIYRELYCQETPGSRVVSAYLTLKDLQLLASTPMDSSPHLNVVDIGNLPDDQSAQAQEAVRQRLDQLRAGIIELNTADDAETWKNRGIGSYALDNTLIQMHLYQATEEML